MVHGVSMETHYIQVQRLQLPVSERHGVPPTSAGVGTMIFDTQQELLWIGTDTVSRPHHCQDITRL